MFTPTGLHQLRAAVSSAGGISDLVGLCPGPLQVGHVTCSLEPRLDFANPMGTVHGGVLARLLTHGCATWLIIQPSPETNS